MRFEGSVGTIEVSGSSVTLTWPDKWSVHEDRKLASPRTIPLAAISRVEVAQKMTGNSVRLHLNGEDESSKYRASESINAVEFNGKQLADAQEFATRLQARVDEAGSHTDPELLVRPSDRLREEREELKRKRRATDDYERTQSMWANSPPGRARGAKLRGDLWFEYRGSVETTQRTALGVFSGDIHDQRTRSQEHADVLSQIEREGWELRFVNHIWKQTGASSRDKLMSSGQSETITGDIIGIYLFRATEAPTRNDRPWESGLALPTTDEGNESHPQPS